MRLKLKTMKDSKTGWGTLKGNQGTTYLEAARSCADSTGDPGKEDWSFEEEPDVRLRADGPGGTGLLSAVGQSTYFLDHDEGFSAFSKSKMPIR